MTSRGAPTHPHREAFLREFRIPEVHEGGFYVPLPPRDVLPRKFQGKHHPRENIAATTKPGTEAKMKIYRKSKAKFDNG